MIKDIKTLAKENKEKEAEEKAKLEEKKFNLPFCMSGKKFFLVYKDYRCFDEGGRHCNKKTRSNKTKTLRFHRQG